MKTILELDVQRRADAVGRQIVDGVIGGVATCGGAERVVAYAKGGAPGDPRPKGVGPIKLDAPGAIRAGVIQIGGDGIRRIRAIQDVVAIAVHPGDRDADFVEGVADAEAGRALLTIAAVDGPGRAFHLRPTTGDGEAREANFNTRAESEMVTRRDRLSIRHRQAGANVDVDSAERVGVVQAEGPSVFNRRIRLRGAGATGGVAGVRAVGHASGEAGEGRRNIRDGRGVVGREDVAVERRRGHGTAAHDFKGAVVEIELRAAVDGAGFAPLGADLVDRADEEGAEAAGDRGEHFVFAGVLLGVAAAVELEEHADFETILKGRRTGEVDVPVLNDVHAGILQIARVRAGGGGRVAVLPIGRQAGAEIARHTNLDGVRSDRGRGQKGRTDDSGRPEEDFLHPVSSPNVRVSSALWRKRQTPVGEVIPRHRSGSYRRRRPRPRWVARRRTGE